MTSADQNPSERNERTSVVAQLASVIQKVDNTIQRMTHYPVDNHYQNQSSYPLDSIQLSPDIYRDAKCRGVYPPLFTDPEGYSCFSIYQIRRQLFKRWITLSTGQITIHWILQLVLLLLIQWIAIYPVDSAIHRLNNWGQMDKKIPLN